MDRKSRPLRIVLTGFGSFPGAAVNPAQAIVRRLLRARAPALRLAGIDLRGDVLPVDYAGVEGAIIRLLQDARPDGVLHLGLAGRRKVISVESRARNRLNTIHPDAAGKFASGMALQNGGPAQRRSRFNTFRLKMAMLRAGAPTAVSIDAGDYLCNQALWITLSRFDGPAGFIHIPRPMRLTRPRGSQKTPRPTLAQMTRAIEAALREFARQTRPRIRAINE